MSNWTGYLIMAGAFAGNVLFLSAVVYLAFSGETIGGSAPHPLEADSALIFTALFGVNALACWRVLTELYDRWPSK